MFFNCMYVMCSQCLAGSHSTSDLCVQKMNIVYNKPYLVKVLSPGSPSRFWLNLKSTSTDKIEKELKMSYSNCTQLITLPRPGDFVVCLNSGKYCRGKVVRCLIIIFQNFKKNYQLCYDF